MKKIPLAVYAIALLFCSPTLAFEIQNTNENSVSESELEPTIETCELLESDSYYTNMLYFEYALINENYAFCQDFPAKEKPENEKFHYPCSDSILSNEPLYDFKYHPQFFSLFDDYMVYNFEDTADFPIPKTKVPLNLSARKTKVLSYLCTRNLIEDISLKLLFLDFRKYEDARKAINELSDKGLLTHIFIQRFSSVGMHILAFEKYPEQFKKDVFFLFLEEASKDIANREHIIYQFEGYKSFDRDILPEDIDNLWVYMITEIKAARVAIKFVKEYKDQAPEKQSDGVLALFKEAGL